MIRLDVVGGGIVGLWVAAAAVRRGHHVTLHEQFSIGHDRGSSSGDTRIFRSAYWEGTEYVSLAHTSAELWDWLSQVCGKKILDMSGIFYAGSQNCSLIAGVEAAARTHGLEVKRLRDECRTLLAGDAADEVVLEEAAGGILRADEALAALTMYCRNAGAKILENAPVSPPRGADTIVIRCIGPWLANDPLAGRHLTSARVYCHWFEHDGSSPLFEKAFLLQGWDGRVLYGMRTGPREIKVGWHNYPVLPLEPGHAADESPLAYVEDIRGALSKITGAQLMHLRSKGCYFTNSTDENYVLDWSGPHELFTGGLSGHGFKFAPALGVGLVEAAETGRIPEHLACFGLSRFDNSSVTGRTHLSDGDILTGANWRI